MNYSYDKFLRPLTESDVTIKILDNTNDIKYTIDPFVIISVSISNNVLKITLKSKSILIDFSSINEAKLALIRIQDQIDTLVQKVPNLIDKQTKNYIIDYVESRFTDIITDIIPSQDSTYNLGSSASQWKSLHVSGQTIYIGGVPLSTDGESLVVSSINLGTTASPLILSANNDVLLLNGTGSVGATGADGLQGPIGPTGADGLQGPIGPTGQDGTSINILGSLADYNEFITGPGATSGTNVGDSWILLSDGSLYIWNGTNWFDAGDLKGPKGDQGEPGNQGPIGATGPQGIQGVTGPAGPQGSAGASVTLLGSYADLTTFNLGAGSASGLNQGDSYIILDTGSLYSWSASSSVWFNAGDIKGPAGPQGPQGPQGNQGPAGNAGNNGLRGATGPQGIQGAQGLQGVTGSAGNSVSASYMRGSRSTQQTTGLTTNGLVVFTQTDNSTGSDISLNTGTGQITLAANKTYRLMAQVPTITNSGLNSRPSFCWYNETSSSWVGSLSAIYSPNDGASFASSMGMSEGLITTTQSTIVSYRIVSNSLVSGLGGSIDFSTTGSYPWFDIEVISGFSPLMNGATGPQGIQGIQGATGSQGPTGATGPQGIQGAQGVQGATGPSGSSGLVAYTLPDTFFNPNTWILLGTWNTAQTGHTLRMKLSAHAGYNAGLNQNQATDLYFAVSNGISTNPSAVGGSYYANGSAFRNEYLGTASTAPSLFRVVQSNINTYLFYGNFGQWAGNSHYTISISGTTSWSHSGATGPTPSGTYLDITPTSSGSGNLYFLEATTADITYTLPGGFVEDPCRYSIVSAAVNVSSSWFDTSTYTFTPQKAGYWEITASYDIYRNTEASMAIEKNNVVIAAAGSFNAVVQTVTRIIYLNGSTDYINIFNTGGAALSRSQFASRSWFQARWVGE